MKEIAWLQCSKGDCSAEVEVVGQVMVMRMMGDGWR